MHRYLAACALSFGVMCAASAEKKAQLLCLQAKDTVDETQCLNQELNKANERLADYLATAQAQINRQNGGKPQIATSQALWLKYRDSHCGDVYAREEGGSYRFRAEIECRIEATRSRTHEIWSAYIRTFGSDVPLRPEP